MNPERTPRPNSPRIPVEIHGEIAVLTWETCCLYFFPHDEQLNHIYTSEAGGQIIYNQTNFMEDLMTLDFPAVFQPIPSKKEIDLYTKWSMRGIGDDVMQTFEDDTRGN